MVDYKKVIPIGSDHAGYQLKKFLIENFRLDEYVLKDYGTFSDEPCDYPDFIHPVAFSVDDGEYEKGIIICGSGQGANMTANKYRDIRSALCWNIEQAELSRRHNNANIIALPGRFIGYEEALNAVNLFLKTEFEGGRHAIRVEKITKMHN